MKPFVLLLLSFFLSIQLYSQAIVITVTTTNESCSPGSDGSASVSVVGGMVPYSYFWSPGAFTTPTLTNLTAGNYSVTVTDANGRTSTAVANVLTSPNPNISIQPSNPSCPGSNDGSATATASSGTPPYVYIWSNANTSATITGLSAGTYSVSVTDVLGCTSTASTTLTDPPNMDTTVSQNGLILTANQGNALYQWLDFTTGVYIPVNGAIAQNFTASLNGFWAVEITLNGCVDTSEIVSTFTIGLENQELKSTDLILYPNPTNGNLFYQGEIGNMNRFRLFDVKGKMVLEGSLSPSGSIELGTMENGLYFLELKGEKYKFLLQK